MGADSVKAWEIAAESLGLAYTPRVRPNPVRWLWYAYWGPLPERHAIWVLYDTTCSSWVVRHLARILAALAIPITALVVFLPASGSVRAATALLAGGCAALFTGTWINESTEHRLIQAGYEWRVGSTLRAKRSQIAQLMRNW